METVSVGIDTLNRIIKSLQDAVDVCYNVDSSESSDHERTYPFATGYSRSAMQNAILDLNRTINN
jgi:hypothetical protein